MKIWLIYLILLRIRVILSSSFLGIWTNINYIFYDLNIISIGFVLYKSNFLFLIRVVLITIIVTLWSRSYMFGSLIVVFFFHIIDSICFFNTFIGNKKRLLFCVFRLGGSRSNFFSFNYLLPELKKI